MASENRSMEPASDSQPIKFDNLLEHEKEIIDRANGLLESMQKGGKGSQASSQDPWATVDADRRHRVLMINGPRGSGKTSLMLTLLAGWRAAADGAWKTIPDLEPRKEAKQMFSRMGRVVRSLKPLDFDPLPPDLPLYGWIVQAFHPLIDWLMREGQNTVFDDSERTRGGLPWSDDTKSLRDQWQDLYQTAIVAWGSDKLRASFQKDIYDFVLAQGNQHKNWHQLQERWQRFLDDLFENLDRRQDIFPKGGLLVLPIDDADLQIERDRELILAIRLLYHPRLAYLITGDRKNLQENLTLEFCGRMMRLAKSGDEKQKDEIVERSRTLASALVSKVLPTSHILEMPGLSIRQTLEWDTVSGKPLSNIKLKSDRSFREFLEERHIVSRALDVDGLLFRKLQQFQDQYVESGTQEAGQPAMTQLVAFLEMLRNEEDPQELVVGYIGGDERGSADRIDLHTYSGPIIPVSRVFDSRRSISQERVEVRLGLELEFYQERPSQSRDREGVPEQASPLTLLALDLAAEFSGNHNETAQVYVYEHTPRIQGLQRLAWSIWHGDIDEVWFPWPSISAKGPTELAKRAFCWAAAVRKLDPTNARWIDQIAFTWIRLHLLWIGGQDQDNPQLPHELGPETDMDDAWSKLTQVCRSPSLLSSLSLPFKYWFNRELPLLTAPEYGLSGNAQQTLYEALKESSQAPTQEWKDSRLRAMSEAKRFKPGEAPEDWFTIRTDYRGPIEESPEALMDAINQAFPNSPWAQISADGENSNQSDTP